jgi:palmitoyltransferase
MENNVRCENDCLQYHEIEPGRAKRQTRQKVFTTRLRQQCRSSSTVIVLMADAALSKLAIPSVGILISFLAYSSQVLFLHLDPGPLQWSELVKFNSLVLGIWISYYRACRTDPGRVPSSWRPKSMSGDDLVKPDQTSEGAGTRSRWCRKCELFKPPRAHHCKTCGR